MMNNKKIVVASNNRHKVNEIKEILKGTGYTVISMSEEGIYTEPEENGLTFADNALIKAKEIARHTDAIVLADDSGLSVDCLGGEPGVRSRRYSGEYSTDMENNTYLMEKVSNYKFEERTARFICCIAMIYPDKTTHIVQESCSGVIVLEPKGDNGFGYDPVFYIPHLDKTFAQLTMEEKNKISHRALALKRIREILLKGN
jgi:XTP/dITP diphosphohydrolase